MRNIVSLLLVVVLAISAAGQQASSPQQLTIENIFAEGGLTGRAPETVKWSPDGTKVSFVQRDDSGEHGALWYVDATTGQKAVLVAEEKLATLAPPISKIKNEREKERIRRYSVASYEWTPDSKHLLFDSLGQLWYYSLATGTAVQITASSDPSSDPKFSFDGRQLAYIRKHNLFVRSIGGEDSEKQLTLNNANDEDLLNGEVDWVYAEELGVRSNFFWEPNGKHIAFLQMDENRCLLIHSPIYCLPIPPWIRRNIPRLEIVTRWFALA